MIFIRDFVTRENQCRIASRRIKIVIHGNSCIILYIIFVAKIVYYAINEFMKKQFLGVAVGTSKKKNQWIWSVKAGFVFNRIWYTKW